MNDIGGQDCDKKDDSEGNCSEDDDSAQHEEEVS